MSKQSDYQFYKELYEERAAIIQYDGGFSQQEAEKKALHQIKMQYVKDNKLAYYGDSDVSIVQIQSTLNKLLKLEREIKKEEGEQS